MVSEVVTIQLIESIERVFPVPATQNRWDKGTEFRARRTDNGWVVVNGPNAGLGIPGAVATEIGKPTRYAKH